MSTAVVVGSGPNGLTAACVLARRGVSVTVVEAAGRPGGGARSTELTVPGLIHDECAAIHPMGVASPAFEELGLTENGVEWLWPEVDVAHPLEDGSSGAMYRWVPCTWSSAWSRETASPKSPILTKPSEDMSRLPGLMSRWIMCRSWR